MHIPVPPRRPVTLFSGSGKHWQYDTLRDLIEAHGLGWIRTSVGAHFREIRHIGGDTPLEITHFYIIRNDAGEIITAEDCAALASPRGAGWSYRWRPAFNTWSGVGPVPYTGVRHRGHYHRRIRTLAEHRAGANVLRDEGEPLLRGARRRGNLPSAWDDRQVAARRDRSWKRFRTTRWKTPRG